MSLKSDLENKIQVTKDNYERELSEHEYNYKLATKRLKDIFEISFSTLKDEAFYDVKRDIVNFGGFALSYDKIIVGEIDAVQIDVEDEENELYDPDKFLESIEYLLSSLKFDYNKKHISKEEQEKRGIDYDVNINEVETKSSNMIEILESIDNQRFIFEKEKMYDEYVSFMM